MRMLYEYDNHSDLIALWFKIFERKADTYELLEPQKYVHARNKITSQTKLFLESENVCDYSELKDSSMSFLDLGIVQMCRKSYKSVED